MPKPTFVAKLLIFLFSLWIVPSRVAGQDTFDITSATLYYPHLFKPKQVKMEFALSQVKLPMDWLETAIQAPLFHFHVNYGLPSDFAVDGRFSSLLISNQLTLGPRWNCQIDRLSFNVGYDVGFTFGYLNQFGFDSSVTSWINYPNASVGFRIEDVAITLKGEFVYVTSFSSKQGDNEITNDNNFANGFTIGFYIEQRVYQKKVLVLGIKDSYAKYHFMAWPAFSTFNRYYHIPEFYLGLIL